MALNRRSFIAGSTALAGVAASGAVRAADMPVLPVTIDTHRPIGALPHVWEECAGSDRAAITLRESWRHDLDRWKAEIGLKRVRFHGIFNDELGVFTPMIVNRYKPAPNFQNVFAVYDGLVARGIAPYIELSFMPKALASGEQNFGFYKGNVSPPTSNAAWADFISLFVKALINRYGLATVRTWMFEVWNEPDLRVFWAGTQLQYFDLYKATAVAIKSVDPQLQVGGPSTSRTNWIPEFAAWTAANNAPVDFFATHCYASDNQNLIFGPGTKMPQADVIPAAVKKARMAIDASPHKGKPLWLSEWSSDSPAMIAHIIKGCLPNLTAMSHWVMSGTYEELGVFSDVVGKSTAGYPNINQGIALPGFNAYKMLHALGHTQLAADGPALASRRADGSTAALVWNLAEASQPSGIPGVMNDRNVRGEAKQLHIHMKGARAGAAVKVQYVDQERGSPYPLWKKMGSPQYPTMAQVAQLRKAAELAPPVTMRLNAASALTMVLPPEGLALVTLS